jgi:hypothetical protein
MTVLTRAPTRPLLAFYLLTFLITGAVGGQCPPTARAFSTCICCAVLHRLARTGDRRVPRYAPPTRPAEDAELLGPLLRWRVGEAWYAAAVLIYTAIRMLARQHPLAADTVTTLTEARSELSVIVPRPHARVPRTPGMSLPVGR